MVVDLRFFRIIVPFIRSITLYFSFIKHNKRHNKEIEKGKGKETSLKKDGIKIIS